MPILCNYYITYRCNAACDFCHFGDASNVENVDQANPEEVLRNLEALSRMGVKFIDFTGGEPLLHPDLPEFLREARRYGMKTSITTNCLLYPKLAEAIRGQVDLLHFSLDSSVAEQHDRMRGVRCFDKVMESIRIAGELNERPDILFTVSDLNGDELGPVYEIARRHGLILILNPIFEYFRAESLSAETLDLIEEYGRKPMVYVNPSFITLRRLGGNNPRKPLCRAVSRVVVLSPQNEILLPCYHFRQEQIPVGDDLVAAYQSERVAWHRLHEGRHDFCEGCAINCYFEPSFAFPTNRFGLAAVPSKLRYGFNKYIRPRLKR
ncbi:MAG: radical SAM protein [Chlorobi bacterium]|nr:radical SAM protein [Chlorobiota bacterium]